MPRLKLSDAETALIMERREKEAIFAKGYTQGWHEALEAAIEVTSHALGGELTTSSVHSMIEALKK